MSSIITSQGLLHYETIGRGKPIVLLHGWINSWDVWRTSMLSLTSQLQQPDNQSRRFYALDFWGFGDSAKPSLDLNNSYQLASYVEMVREFMDYMGLLKAPIAGHSMGGTVALQLALTYPERIEKVIVVGSPIVGSSLNLFLKLAGYQSIARLIWKYPIIRSIVMKLLLTGDNQQVQNMIFRDVERTTLDSFFRSIGDLRDTDLLEDLQNLTVPTLGIYGKRDNIVSPDNADLLMNRTDKAQVSIMNYSRHFPMKDEPDRFVNLVSDFLRQNGNI